MVIKLIKMAKSKITITFTGVPAIGDYLNITNSLAPSGTISEIFTSIRQAAHQSTIGSTNTISASNFNTAVSIDNGNSGLYTITISGNIVEIISTISNAVFTLAAVLGTTWRTIVIDNQVEEVPIVINSIEFLKEVGNPCANTLVKVTTSVLATKYSIDGGVQVVNTFNPFSYIQARGTSKTLQVLAANLTIATKIVKAPVVLAAGNVSISILNTPNGATLTVTLYDSYGLVLQYSLDGVTWRTNNVFTGIAPGNYTLYVKDQLGCSVTKAFVVEAFNPNVTTECPVSYISESMSIRFKHNEVWDNVDVYKTDFNTLSCEEDTIVAFQYKQMFKTSNIVSTQLLSNYQNIQVNILREDNTKVNVPIYMLKKFVDLKDSRDAQVKQITPAKAGVYYTTGNTYDYVTGVANGVYALNGSLPDYASVGNYIELKTVGWFLIEDIIFDEALNVEMLVITYVMPSSPITTIVKSNWNQKNFNLFEFNIDFAPYLNEYIQVEILQDSPGFPDFNYLSEIIEVRNTFKDSIEMIWFNYEDSNVFYSTGIKNIGNFLLASFVSGNDSEVVINKTPNTSIMVNASNYDTKELVLEDLTTAIMKQVSQAVLHKGLIINRVPYVASSNPSTEVVESTNLHSLTAPLNLTNPPYLACQPSGSPSPLFPPSAVGNSPT
jgi:hypothetical protein